MPKSRSSYTFQNITYLCFIIETFFLNSVFSLDADVWKKFLSRPALPFILRLLRGLATQHPPTQVLNIFNEKLY